MESNITVGLISRVMEIDIPFYSEWLEYYDKLGIDSFYLIIHDVNFIDLKSVLKYYPEKKIKSIIFRDAKIRSDPNSSLRADFFNITDDYLLNVDSDEFLYLKGMGIKEFIYANLEFNYFRFNWLMVPGFKDNYNSFNELLNSNEKKYFLTQYKSMLKIKDFENYKLSPHDFDIDFTINDNKELLKEYSDFDNFFIIHFSFRSKSDAYLKYKYQFLMDMTPTKQIEDNPIFNSKTKTLLGINIPQRIFIYIGEIFNTNKQEDNSKFTDLLQLENKTDIDYLNKLINLDEYNEFCLKLEKIINFNIFDNLKLVYRPKEEIRNYFYKNYSNFNFVL